jgi:extracellular elastinolytic metalloproteinase
MAAAAHAAPLPPAPPQADERFLDVRLAERNQAAAANAPAGLAARSPGARARVEDARTALTDDLGREAVLDVDPLSGSVRQLARLDGALSTPTGTGPATTAREYARDHATALGLDPADVEDLVVDGQQRSPSGLTVVRFAQQVDGIPAFDNGMVVALDHAGRVLSVSGAPRSDLPHGVPASAPTLTAPQALDRLMIQTGRRRTDVRVTTTNTNDPRRTTVFSTGDVARLVLFGARDVHLAWHLTYQATSTRWYDAVIDALTGEVLYRANLVKFAGVYRNYPGAPNGGTQESKPLTDYLAPGATTLTGPNVHAWADLDDDDVASSDEEIDPGTTYSPVTGSSAPGCDAGHLCAWDHTTPASWDAGPPTNRRAQNVNQTFWYANNYHDHLAQPPIGFTGVSGAFEGDDPLDLNALDGATTGTGTRAGGPDSDHLDYANMATPPDGWSPRMQMYLFAYRPSGAPPAAFRDINGGDDAAIVYHEYTHGLTSRLVTYDDGTEALNSPHAGAMGEGWSDWYAQDFLVRDGLVDDTPADGDVDMGRYADALPHSIRYQALDCAVGSANAAACPAVANRTPAGGFTFGDFGRIAGAPEVHADGEIWAQTLWQLRQRLIAKLGSDAAGSDAAERIITDALRLSVPEPSFLDMRNAILQADTNATGGADRDLIWDVFRSRGMGFYAAVADSRDTAPIEDFSAPPPAGTPRGSIGGTVTSADTGLPVGDVVASIGGLSTDPSLDTFLTGTSDGAGHYGIGDVPPGTYGKVIFRSGAGFDRAVQTATVAGGQVTPLDVKLERDWAAHAGGANVGSTNDDEGEPFGCGAAALIDQSDAAGWSAVDHRADPDPAKRILPVTTIVLPQPLTVTRFGMNPSNTCGDGEESSTKGYRLETSPDGQSWTTAAQGEFGPGDRDRLNPVTPTAGAERVKYLRLTLLSPQRETSPTTDTKYLDFTELAVYGRPPNALPSGSLVPSATAPVSGEAVTLDAGSFRDPDSAIAGYDWDVDGDGTIDRTTGEPAIVTSYANPGGARPTVSVRDYRGGAGVASAALTVIAPAPGTPILPPGPTVPKRPPPKKATPSLKLPRTGTKGRIRLRVTCKDTCKVSGTLTVSKAVKKRAHLRSTTVRRLRTLTVKGTKTITIALTADARRRLRRHHLRKVRVALRLTATVSGTGGPRKSATRGVTVKL